MGRLQNRLANSRPIKALLRTIMKRLPFAVLESDVRDVIYANWVVPAEAVADLVPPGVEIVQVDGHTILTILTYAHGHFGPALAGSGRRLFPSPRQSNWRLYVTGIGAASPTKPTVLFLANIFDSALYAVGTRLFSDVMLAHHAHNFRHGRQGDIWTTGVESAGSAPDWLIRVRDTESATIPPEFRPFFATYADALNSLCLQDAAIAPVDGMAALAIAEIDLPIAIESCVPMLVETYRPGSLLDRIGATSEPFCFRVPKVRFRALSEHLITI